MSEPAGREGPANDALAARLGALEAAGARGLDTLDCEHLRDLLARASALGGRAELLLRERASARLSELEARREGPGRVSPAAVRWASGTDAGDDEQSTAARAASARDYREAAASWTAAFSLARAVDQVPAGAGPLNGQRLAARALRAAEAVSPLYARSLTSSLADLAPLLELPEARPPRKRAAGR
jgi:Protein of unknown function (DUF2894)